MTSAMWMTSWFVLCYVTMTSACPDVCACAGTTVVCSDRGLTYVPKNIPLTTEVLNLQRNNITELTAGDFSGLQRLKILNAERNLISGINYRTFDDVVNLKALLLNHNRISCIQDKTFRAVKKLEVLTLDNNNITSFSPQALRNKMLNLRTFRMHTNPLKCDCHLVWFADWLKRRPRMALFTHCDQPMILRGSKLASADRRHFTCNELTSQRRPTCDAFACPHSCICENGVVDCRDRGLQTLPKTFPRDSTELRLEQNNIQLIPAYAFSSYKLLTRIDVSNNDIREIERNAFQGLERLTSLVLYGNKIVSLPQGCFTGLRSLEMLLLNANKISCLHQDVFDGLQALTLLSLYDNKLQSLSKGTFDSLHSIETLHLANNPFRCDCRLRWLAKYLKKRPVETSGVRCISPPRVAGKKVALVKPRRYRCSQIDLSRVSPPSGSCAPQTECPKSCVCEEGTITCTGAQLTAVPDDIPPYVSELILNHNNIEVIRNDGTFRKLTGLKKLDLSNNQIAKIEDGAFSGAASVVDLRLNDNLLSDVRGSMFGGLSNLRMLLVRNNHLTCIGNHSFAGLHTVNHLSLYGNQISTITDGAFDGLSSISTLNLLSNPLNCNCHMSWFSSWLRRRRLASGNPRCAAPSILSNFPVADINPSDFRCPAGAGGQRSTEAPTCEPVRKCPAACACEGTIVRCSKARLTSVPVEHIPDDVTELYLAMNEISEIPAEINKFVHLTTLDLSENRIRSLKDGMFRNLTRTTTLLLAYNQLRCVPRHAFAGLHSIKFLSLHANELSSLPEGSFDDFFQISRVGLGANPWHCDCNLRWLIEKIQADEIKSGIARCSGPDRMTGRLLLTSPVQSFRCQGPLDIAIAAKCNPCLSSPCQYNSTCSIDATEYYHCSCLPGFKGRHCEKPIDPCILRPCQNGATCRARNEKVYICLCPAGIEGVHCERNIDDCQPDSCPGDHVTCIDRVNNFTCACERGWTGENCDEEIVDFCDLNRPCENNGTCVTLPDLDSLSTSYRCECAFGYRGENCTEHYQPCLHHKCENGASCHLDPLSPIGYRCQCQQDFSGQYCSIFGDEKVNILQDDPCYKHECLNGGECDVIRTSSDYQCRCLPGFSGRRCEMLASLSFSLNGSYVELDRPEVVTSSSSPDAAMTSSTEPTGYNLTLYVSTLQMNGILLYWGEVPTQQGVNDYLAVELFSGHVRLNFDLGRRPGAAMYSPVPINDGRTHMVEILVATRVISLRVDSGAAVTQQVPGGGVLGDTRWMHVGGVGGAVLQPAMNLWYFRNSTSFNGCLHAFFVNRQLKNFVGVDRLRGNPGQVTAGCGATRCSARCVNGACFFSSADRQMACLCEDGYVGDSCDEERSQSNSCPQNFCSHGTCSLDGGIPVCNCDPGYGGSRCEERRNSCEDDCVRGRCLLTSSGGYKCQCNRHFTGPSCRTRIRKCPGTRVRRLYKMTRASAVTSSSVTSSWNATTTTSCTSARPFTTLECGGRCGALMTSSMTSCCAPLRVQTRSIRMTCDDGTQTTQTVRKVRSCGCVASMTSTC